MDNLYLLDCESFILFNKVDKLTVAALGCSAIYYAKSNLKILTNGGHSRVALEQVVKLAKYFGQANKPRI